MSDRNNYYNDEPLSNEEKDALKMNFLLVLRGNIPAKKEYYDEGMYWLFYKWAKNRLDVLREDIKEAYKPSGTYELPKELHKFNLLYPSTEPSEKGNSILNKALKKFSNWNTAADIFVSHYDYIWGILNTFGKEYLDKYRKETGMDFEYELLAYMYATTGMVVGSKKCRDAVQMQILHLIQTNYGWCNLYMDAFNKRCALYSNIYKKNKARGEWMLGKVSDYPIINTFIAFGDILFNPPCAKGYFNSPMLIVDIFETVEFVKVMNPIQDKVREYINQLYKALK